MGSILRCSIPVTERDMTHICIVAIKDKKMGFNHIDVVYFVYIMSSCLRRYSVFVNLIPQMHAGQRSMGGVIVVDAGRSWSTCLGRDAYILDHCHESVIIICFSINCPTVICLPTVCYSFEREASSENYGPRVYLNHIKRNLKIPCCNLFTFIFISILVYLFTSIRFNPCK